jgi:type VI secretion system protein ImpL
MLALLKNRVLMTALGLVLAALLVWFAGPYIAFMDHKPLFGAVARLSVILVMVVVYAAVVQLRQMRNARASGRLVDEVTQQSDGEAPLSRAAAADTAQLRKRFEEAIATLKRSRRKGLASLYELPWYIIIGPPGSGKTTALVSSGLNFPLAQKFGKEALRGAGGTRNCDWWFTDEAILLDTAGRYTTQDSDARADAAGWGEFLQLLCKYRRRRPINGVIVAMSASDLLTLNEREAERHAIAIRQRLDELSRNVRIDVPVYFLVTKTDLVAGFAEFFDELGQEGRAQVWGATFPLEQTESGRAAAAFGREFDQLIERLQERVLFRVEGERDPRRRIGILAFPRQMAALKPLLDGLLQRVFSVSDFDHRLLLRGVYFTSGTQEGTPIDRMLGAVARTFGFSTAVTSPGAVQGKAYFIEKLLRQVVFQESGLAGSNRKAQLQSIALQSAAYAACAVALVLGLVALGVSYSANANYIDAVSTTAGKLAATEKEPGSELSTELALSRLDALREITQAAEKYKADVPWRMRSGLYRGSSLGSAARDAYTRELNGVLPIVLSVRFAQQLRVNASAPDRLYEYLKGYLMLGEDEHRDAEYLRSLSRLEWQRMFADDSTTAERLSEHFDELLADPHRLRSVSFDPQLVEQTRTALRSASLASLMYSRLKLGYLDDTRRAVRLDLAAGASMPLIFTRRSGKPLSEPVPALYTRPAFEELTKTGRLELVRQFAADAWVFGSGPLDLVRSRALVQEVLAVYEQDYIRAWDEVLRDITLKPTSNAQQLAEVLTIAAGPDSPFKGLLVTVAKNTDFSATKPSASSQLAERALEGRASQLMKILGSDSPAEARPGARIAAHFGPIRQLVATSDTGTAPIDAILLSLSDTQRRLQGMGSGLGDTSALDALSRSGEVDALRALQLVAKQLPPPVGDMIAQIGVRTEVAAVSEARVDLARRYDQQVLRECRELVEGRYPFNRASANDVPLGDFSRVFGPAGVFDTFFRENLAPLVDTSRSPWRWRPGAAPIGGSGSLLRQFEQVQRIRDTYFGRSGQAPEARFYLVPDALDAAVTRFTLDLDGQSFEYRHGPQQSRPMSWPGGAGQASFSFEERGSSVPGLSKQGAWAWFRLLAESRVERQSEVRYRVTFSAGGRSMRVILDAASARNPFGSNALAGFSCAM